MVKLAVVLLVSSFCSGAFASAPGRRTLSFDDRVRAQEAIERVDDATSTGAGQTVDLFVTASVAPEPVVAGGLLTYTIVMTNAGPGDALYANMLDPLPLGTTRESITWSGPEASWNCIAPAVGANGKVSCAKKLFAPGDSVTFTITVKVEPCAEAPELNNTATASSLTPESDPANNTATSATTVNDPGTCDDRNACTIDDRCGPALGFTESFDLVEAPAIPAGWTAVLVSGLPGTATWKTRVNVYDTEPNAVFVPDADSTTDCVLDSPPIVIMAPNAQLTFRNLYNLERDFDGGVLEIKMGTETSFRDIVEAGGSFETGDYNGTIPLLFNSPIHGRRAWTGASLQFVLTTVNLPAEAFGKSIVLRWRMATDRDVGGVGQWIDSVSIASRNSCQPGTLVACDDNDACTADACDAVTGCLHASIACDDGNSCTDDACDAGLQCVYTNTTAACDDRNACTRTDVCRAGACAGSNPVVCHDADLCTADACDPAIGCVAPTANLDTSGFSAARVDGRDLAVLAASWNSCPGDARYNAAADLDRQGPCVDATDFHLFMNAFGRNCVP